MTSIESLPPKQRQVLEQLQAFLQENGYPPSIQQLCQLCEVSSTSTIHYHLSALKKKGFIHWNPSEKRAISLLCEVLCDSDAEEERTPQDDRPGRLPMLGSIAAGQPLQTLQDSFETLDLSEDLCPRGCYALRVRGYSMIEDHIMDEDIVIINPKTRWRDGDVVVALVESETATLKRIYHEKDGLIRLQPANETMEPIYSRDVQVQGKVEAIIRKL